ncbi:hypothetical protein [Flavobacterium sp.]|uniref:hypothetical protein n=1 Tax=Flavobacterium sp. TaxID=239 RepID=UPI004047F184
MAKVSIVTEQIQSKRVFRQQNITCIVVSNFSTVATSFIFNGIVRKLPAIDVSGVPVSPFEISANGNPFDIELNFNQDANNLVIDYTVIITEQKC